MDGVTVATLPRAFFLFSFLFVRAANGVKFQLFQAIKRYNQCIILCPRLQGKTEDGGTISIVHEKWITPRKTEVLLFYYTYIGGVINDHYESAGAMT
jgi:hypothetical protein